MKIRHFPTKIDIKKLPKPTLNLDYVEPENELEEKLFEFVSSLNNTEKFGTTDRQRKSVLSCKTCLCCTLEKKECRQDKRISGKFLLETSRRKINLNSHS